MFSGSIHLLELNCILNIFIFKSMFKFKIFNLTDLLFVIDGNVNWWVEYLPINNFCMKVKSFFSFH